MLSIADGGLRRELQSILTMYLATLLNGYSSGFSAVAVPGIKEEMERRWRLESWIPSVHLICFIRGNYSFSHIPTIEATEGNFSWFGNYPDIILSLSQI